MTRTSIPGGLLLATLLTAALLPTADAAVIPVVSGDTLTITGDGAADSITVRPTSPTTLEVNGTEFDRSAFTKLAVRSGAGDDSIRILGALTETVTIEAGAGADTVIGGPGREIVVAGDDADLVHPGGGDDTVSLGAGDDTVIQGDGLDEVDGQAGQDRLQAVGTDDSEEFTLQASGSQARVSRDTGPATTNSRGVETLEVVASGGPDLVDVGDLRPTEVVVVETELGAFDDAVDQVALQGTDATDLVEVRRDGEGLEVEGLDPEVRIRQVQADDRLSVAGRGGTDILSARPDIGERVALTLDGGTGTDVLEGTDAADTLRGGADVDVVVGRGGADLVDLGDGDDFYRHGPQDGLDRVDGGAGEDVLEVSGSAGDDAIEVRRLLSRTRVRHGNPFTADTTAVEHVTVSPLAGTDTVTVGELTGTATRVVDVDLRQPDLRVDTLVVGGTLGDDSITVATTGTTHTVGGLPYVVNLVNPERGEKIVVDGGNGKDTIDARGLEKDRLQPSLNGSAGDDVILGSPGQDLVAGGIGVDVAFLGSGLDTFTWKPGHGNDIVEGGAGTDFLQVDGSGGNDRFDVFPVGGRSIVSRDIDNVRLDLNDLERIDLLPGSGGDIVRVADLSGTDTDRVDVHLAPARSTIGGDDLIDRVFIDGTFGDDAIVVNGAGPDVRTSGLAAITTVRGTDPELDRLHVDTRPGNDTFTVTGTAQQLIGLTHS